MRVQRCADVWVSGGLDVWVPGVLDVWVSGVLDVWVSRVRQVRCECQGGACASASERESVGVADAKHGGQAAPATRCGQSAGARVTTG